MPVRKKSAATDAARRRRARTLLRELHELYPDADCELLHDGPLQLLVATVLSAQCTDERVNRVTRDLFGRYRTAADYAAAPREELEEAIRSTGFFRNKAKNIQGLARDLVERHGGDVPEDMDALVALPGVARKTANVVLGTAFGRNEGVVVDTHVHRLARRLGFSDERDPAKVERDLMTLFPRREWTYLGHALIQHGRRTCRARKPACEACPLRRSCPSAGAESS